MLENKASDGMTFADWLADGTMPTEVRFAGCGDCAVGERAKREGRVVSAELGRNRPQMTGNVGNPLNKNGRHRRIRGLCQSTIDKR
jgi:hypothetical protein